MKRWLDRLLSKGKGIQLLWLLGLSMVVIGLALFMSCLLFEDIPWQQTVAVFLDPGCFGNADYLDSSSYVNANYGAEALRLLLALFSLVVLSGLLVSTFTNVVENISESVRTGRRRYKFTDHVLIIGGGKQLEPMLAALAEDSRQVVVMSESRP